MKKVGKLLKIILLILALVVVSVIVNKVTADSTSLVLSITTDKESYLVGEDVEVSVKLDKNIMTASYYLNYNSSVMDFKEVKSPASGMTVRNIPADNLVRAIYFDMSGVGLDEMVFVFTVKDKTDDIAFRLTNTSMTISGETKAFNQSNITGIDGVGSITVTETPYKVEHYIEQANGTFAIDETLTENLTGVTGATATATPKTITGYTEDTTNVSRVPSGVITLDGNLVLKLYYKAKTNIAYKVEHYKEQTDGTFAKDNTLTQNLTGTTGKTVTAVAKTITGYIEDTTNVNRVPSGVVAADGSLVLKLYYKMTSDTAYKVEHYKEQADGTFAIDNSLTENLAGKAGNTVTATAKTIVGYTEDTTNSSRVASGTILADGSLVLKLYYKANTDTAYKVEYYKEQADGTFAKDSTLTENLTGKTGSTVTATAKTIAGYTEDITSESRVASGIIAPDGSLILKLIYNANIDTPYKVEYYIKQEDGTFAKDDTLTENLTGKTGSTVTATVKTIEGYKEDTSNTNRVASGSILGDGSLVLKVYYKLSTDIEEETNKPDEENTIDEEEKPSTDNSSEEKKEEVKSDSNTKGEVVNQEQKTNKIKADNTSLKISLPKTGFENSFVFIIVVLIIVSICFGYKFIQINKDLKY